MSPIEYFTAPGHPYNCAQSVALGTGHPELEEELRSRGGGRAPEGFCGALHATLLLTPPERHDEVKKAFLKDAGALTCREIKGVAKTPCARCIEIAEGIISDFVSRRGAEAQRVS